MDYIISYHLLVLRMAIGRVFVVNGGVQFDDCSWNRANFCGGSCSKNSLVHESIIRHRRLSIDTVVEISTRNVVSENRRELLSE